MIDSLRFDAASRFSIALRLAAATSAALLLASGCSSTPAAGTGTQDGGKGGRDGSGAPVAVVTAPVVAKSMPVRVKSVGNVEASSTVEVRSQLTGELEQIGFEEGQEVQAGQLLFKIDARSFEAALKQAEATLARDRAQAQNLEAQLVRVQNMAKNGLASRADLDAATAGAAAIQATIAANAAAVETTRLQVERTRIVAPVAGRTGALLVHRGALIRANDTAPLVVINQMAPVYVSFAVPARLLPQLQRATASGGLPVEVAVSGAGDRVSGRVTFIDNRVDVSTDTIRLKATIRNEQRRLWPGAFVDVSLQLAVQPRALVVPAAAVQQGQQGPFVYVVKQDHTVELRLIRVAWTEGAEAILESGVQAGEIVVTDGQLRLTPGARVTAKTADEAEKSP